MDISSISCSFQGNEFTRKAIRAMASVRGKTVAEFMRETVGKVYGSELTDREDFFAKSDDVHHQSTASAITEGKK